MGRTPCVVAYFCSQPSWLARPSRLEIEFPPPWFTQALELIKSTLHSVSLARRSSFKGFPVLSHLHDPGRTFLAIWQPRTNSKLKALTKSLLSASTTLLLWMLGLTPRKWAATG